MKRLLYPSIILGAIVFGVVFNRGIGWVRGDKHVHERTVRIPVEPDKVKDPDKRRTYFVEYIVNDVYKPSNTPLLYVSVVDTVKRNGLCSIPK